MTTVLPHLKIAWGGSIGTPALEVWTNSLAWMCKTGGDWDSVVSRGLEGTQHNIEGASTAIGQWFQTAAQTGDNPINKGAGISPAAKLEWVKLNLIGADGKYMFASNTRFYPAPIPGGGVTGSSGTYNPPWQATTAITLRTTISRGRGSKGRIYPPLCGAMPDSSSPYISDVVSSLMTNGFAGLIDNLNSGLYFSTLDSGASSGYDDQIGALASTPGNCCIVSTSPASGPHAGAAPLLTPILTVEVDRVMDVQTRRVNRVPRMVGNKQTVTLNI